MVTTLPAPTIAFSPIVIPDSNVALEPIEAPFLTKVGIQTQSSSAWRFERGRRSGAGHRREPTRELLGTG